MVPDDPLPPDLIDAALVQIDTMGVSGVAVPVPQTHWWLAGGAGGASILGAWTQADGSGVSIGVIDTGINAAHQDFAPRPQAFAQMALGPGPTNPHGTRVAGLIHGRVDNTIAGMGVAPAANVVATWLDFAAPLVVGDVAQALLAQSALDVSNNSWGFSRAFQDSFLTASFRALGQSLHTGVTEGRDGLGTVFVFAAGNGRLMRDGQNVGDDSNFHNLSNSRQTIAVGATDPDGRATVFSSPGTNLLLSAPGIGLVTADGLQAGSTGEALVTGTSFSAALVSGVVALMLQVNPRLGYRDVQEILVLSARARPGDGGVDGGATENGATMVNGGGLLFDREIGFGLLDAEAAVRLARSWQRTSDSRNEVSLVQGMGNALNPDPLMQEMSVQVAAPEGGLRVQWVELRLTVANVSLRTMQIELVSPSGTVSVIAPNLAAAGNARSLDFTFTTAANWGEDVAGNWTLRLSHPQAASGFKVYGASFAFHGDSASDREHYLTPSFTQLATESESRRVIVNSTSDDATLNLAAMDRGVTVNLALGTGAVEGLDFSLVGPFRGLVGTDLRDRLTGSDFRDTVSGGWGDDVIRGGAGADDLSGGTGHDTLAGNDGADMIRGNEGNDVLHGGAGNDTLAGNAGNDQIFGGAGRDRLVGGAGHDTLFGGAGNDLIDGGANNDVLYGEDGSDTLTGGPGRDQFVFDTGIGASIDVITDFNVADDTILLLDSVFEGLRKGPLDDLAFVANTTGQAETGSHRLIYVSDTGALWFDADGNGAIERVQFATLTPGLDLSAADFLVF